MKINSLVLISLTIVGAWLLLLLSFFFMKQVLLLTDDAKGITIELLRDLIGIIILIIWTLAFYAIRKFTATYLLRS